MGLCEVAERRRGTRVPQRWWEQPGIDWRLAREKVAAAAAAAAAEAAAAAAAQAGANEAVSETPGLGSGSESESEPDPTPGGTAGGTGEEASLGVSGSSGAEWSGAED